MSRPASQDPPLVASFRFDGERFEGSVEEVQDRCVELALPAGNARSVPIRRALEVRFDGGALEAPLLVEAWPTMWQATDERDRFLLELDPVVALRVQNALSPKRAALRIPVRGPKAVRVRVEDLAGTACLETALVDVSERGVGLVLATRADATFAAAMTDAEPHDRWRMALSFRLPGCDDALSLIGEVRYRMHQRGFVKYGVAIDPEATEAAFPRQAGALEDDLLRFRERLRAAA